MNRFLFIKQLSNKMKVNNYVFCHQHFIYNLSREDRVKKMSYHIYNILQLTGEFLSVPCSYWPNFGEYKKLEEFCLNLPSVNDSAERGCHLITEFMNQVHSDEARQDLVQCVQYWRKLIKPDFYKKSLKNI